MAPRLFLGLVSGTFVASIALALAIAYAVVKGASAADGGKNERPVAASKEAKAGCFEVQLEPGDCVTFRVVGTVVEVTKVDAGKSDGSEQ